MFRISNILFRSPFVRLRPSILSAFPAFVSITPRRCLSFIPTSQIYPSPFSPSSSPSFSLRTSSVPNRHFFPFRRRRPLPLSSADYDLDTDRPAAIPPPLSHLRPDLPPAASGRIAITVILTFGLVVVFLVVVLLFVYTRNQASLRSDLTDLVVSTLSDESGASLSRLSVDEILVLLNEAADQTEFQEALASVIRDRMTVEPNRTLLAQIVGMIVLTHRADLVWEVRRRVVELLGDPLFRDEMRLGLVDWMRSREGKLAVYEVVSEQMRDPDTRLGQADLGRELLDDPDVRDRLQGALADSVAEALLHDPDVLQYVADSASDTLRSYHEVSATTGLDGGRTYRVRDDETGVSFSIRVRETEIEEDGEVVPVGVGVGAAAEPRTEREAELVAIFQDAVRQAIREMQEKKKAQQRLIQTVAAPVPVPAGIYDDDDNHDQESFHAEVILEDLPQDEEIIEIVDDVRAPKRESVEITHHHVEVE